MKRKRKAVQPILTTHPVHAFDRAISQIVSHLKRDEPLDAAAGATKALTNKRLSNAQRAELMILQGKALMLAKRFGPAREALYSATSNNGSSTLNRRTVQIALVLSQIHLADLKSKRKFDAKLRDSAWDEAQKAEKIALLCGYDTVEIVQYRAMNGI